MPKKEPRVILLHSIGALLQGGYSVQSNTTFQISIGIPLSVWRKTITHSGKKHSLAVKHTHHLFFEVIKFFQPWKITCVPAVYVTEFTRVGQLRPRDTLTIGNIFYSCYLEPRVLIATIFSLLSLSKQIMALKNTEKIQREVGTKKHKRGHQQIQF